MPKCFFDHKWGEYGEPYVLTHHRGAGWQGDTYYEEAFNWKATCQQRKCLRCGLRNVKRIADSVQP